MKRARVQTATLAALYLCWLLQLGGKSAYPEVFDSTGVQVSLALLVVVLATVGLLLAVDLIFAGIRPAANLLRAELAGILEGKT